MLFKVKSKFTLREYPVYALLPPTPEIPFTRFFIFDERIPNTQDGFKWVESKDYKPVMDSERG